MARKKSIDNNQENNNWIYQDDIEMYIQEYCQLRNIKDYSKIPAPQWTGALIYTGKHIDKSRLKHGNNWNIFAVDMLLDRYISLCFDYNQYIYIQAFCLLSNIDNQTIHRWKNDHNKIYAIDVLSDKELYIYMNHKGIKDPGKVTICRYDIYKKLITNQELSVLNNATYKGNVASIMQVNRFDSRHHGKQESVVVAYDRLEIAQSLGITTELQALENKTKRENKRKKDNKIP